MTANDQCEVKVLFTEKLPEAFLAGGSNTVPRLRVQRASFVAEIQTRALGIPKTILFS